MRNSRVVAVLALSLFSWASACSKKEPPAPAPLVKEAPAEPPKAVPEQPLTIAYSDWPGWVAWDIGVAKGFFAEEGVNVELKWFEYAPSMEAFAAGKVDAVAMTNGDALVTGANGAASKGILINDYSNGNDMIVARPGIADVKALKGKKVGVEVGFVDHLLLMKALDANGMTDKDVTIVNLPTDQLPQALASGAVDAISAWQPHSGTALKELAGSKAIFTSADVPGLIYDLLYVSPKSLAEHRDAWKKVVKVWFRIADFIADEKNKDEVLAIMSKRVGLTPEAYGKLMTGTAFLGLAGNVDHFAAKLAASSTTVDAFNVKNAVYKAAVDPAPYLEPGLVQELAAEARK